MNLIDAYLGELEHEAESTRRLLEAAPESKYGWRPHEKGMTLGELCSHIATAPGQMTEVLGGDSFDIEQRPGHGEAPASRDELLKAHDASVSTAKNWIANLGPSAGAMWTLYRGDAKLMEFPRAAAVRSFLFNHWYHHRGQLSTYLRSIGEVVPPVYGPTADIDPFA